MSDWSGCLASTPAIHRETAGTVQLEVQTLRGVEKAIVESALATSDELQALVAQYEAAKTVTFEYWAGHLYNELLAQVPER